MAKKDAEKGGEQAATEDGFEFQVESGIDVPPIRQKSKYPWEKVGSGQSVLVPEAAESSARSWLSKHRPGWLCIRRSDPGEERIRLWFYSPEDAMAAGLLDPETGGEAADAGS